MGMLQREAGTRDGDCTLQTNIMLSEVEDTGWHGVYHSVLETESRRLLLHREDDLAEKMKEPAPHTICTEMRETQCPRAKSPTEHGAHTAHHHLLPRPLAQNINMRWIRKGINFESNKQLVRTFCALPSGLEVLQEPYSPSVSNTHMKIRADTSVFTKCATTANSLY